MKSSIIVLAVVVAVELVWLVGMGRYVDHYSVSIESTELWYNPWVAPGDRTGVMNGGNRSPSGPGVAADSSKTGVTIR